MPTDTASDPISIPSRPKQPRASFKALPNELILILIGHLDTARDVSNLSKTCRRLHAIVKSARGWQLFTKARFSDLDISGISRDGAWEDAVRQLTRNSRCWAKRSINFSAIKTSRPHRVFTRPPHFDRPYDACVSVKVDVRGDELLVVGAGEDLLVRRGGRDSQKALSANCENILQQEPWLRLRGSELGLKPGPDDISAVAAVPISSHGIDRPVALVGRHNGSLEMFDASQAGFATKVAIFGVPGRQQHSINSIEVDHSRQIMLAKAGSSVLLYDLPDTPSKDENILPATLHMLEENAASNVAGRSQGVAKWLSRHVIAVTSSVTPSEALRYLKTTSSGWQETAANKVERLAALKEPRIVYPAITPVYAAPNADTDSSLLLSSWQDGTIVLQDLRTPSPYDFIFADRVNPHHSHGSLLAYGFSHFVAGQASSPIVKVFDFRSPHPYNHTAALPCSKYPPFPCKKSDLSLTSQPVCCNYINNQRCVFHNLSRRLDQRSGASIFLAASLQRDAGFGTRGIFKMAKASDTSDSFYIGLSGDLVEATLGQGQLPSPALPLPPADHPRPIPVGSLQDRRRNRHVRPEHEQTIGPEVICDRVRLSTQLMETGDGEWLGADADRNIVLPALRGVDGGGPFSRDDACLSPSSKTYQTWRRHHRLDDRYHRPDDYAGLVE